MSIKNKQINILSILMQLYGNKFPKKIINGKLGKLNNVISPNRSLMVIWDIDIIPAIRQNVAYIETVNALIKLHISTIMAISKPYCYA
jgi:hypothetical protein